MVVQDQTLATKAYRVTIMKQQGSKKCRMCNKKDEAVMHILSEYSKLAQIKSPLWLTGNYVVSMALNMPNHGMNTKQGEGRGGGVDEEPGHKVLGNISNVE